MCNLFLNCKCVCGRFFLCVIHKGGLRPSSEDINRLMMMMKRYLESVSPSSSYPYPTKPTTTPLDQRLNVPSEAQRSSR
jgi:hypothetical protein